MTRTCRGGLPLDEARAYRTDGFRRGCGIRVLCRVLGSFRTGCRTSINEQVAIQLIRGHYAAPGLLQLTDKSRLRLRLPAEDLPNNLSLADKSVGVDGHTLTIGIPQTTLLRPAVALYAHVVTTRNGDDEARFDTEIGRQLDTLGIPARATRGSGATATL
jgi:CRISPR-associated protein Cas6